MAPRDLTGKLVAITGGARGIGQATAALFLRRGARIAILDLDLETAEATTKQLSEHGGEVRAYRLDVRDRIAFDEVIAKVELAQGAIDVLVNNAGIMSLGAFLDQSADADRRQIEINLLGVIHGMRAVLPRMQGRRRGHVVNVASMAGKLGVPYAATYSATKHAVVGLTEAVRLENRKTGVDFSYVMPIPVRTELIAGASKMSWPPPVEPEDVALAIVEAVQHRRVDVFVPSHQKWMSVLAFALPRVVVEWAAHVTRFDRFFRDVDEAQRAAYLARSMGQAEPPKVRVVGR